MTFLFALPVFRVQWQAVRVLSNGAYRDYVDALMRETPVRRQDNFREAWNAHSAETLAAHQV